MTELDWRRRGLLGLPPDPDQPPRPEPPLTLEDLAARVDALERKVGPPEDAGRPGP